MPRTISINDLDELDIQEDHRLTHASRVAWVVRMARRLDRLDRRIVVGVLASGRPMRAVAARLRLSPDRLARRFRHLVRRITSRPFQTTARHLRRLPMEDRPFARAAFLTGRPLRALAQLEGLSIHAARRRRAALLARLRRWDAGLRTSDSFNS